MNVNNENNEPPGGGSIFSTFWRWLIPHLSSVKSQSDGMGPGDEFDIRICPLVETLDEVIIHARVDSGISHSIISASKAKELGYDSNSCGSLNIHDSEGREYTSNEYVSLTWRRKEASKTHDEDFFVVESVTPEVLFASSSVPGLAEPKTHLLEHGPQTEEEKAAQDQTTKQVKEQRDAQTKDLRAAEASQREEQRRKGK